MTINFTLLLPLCLLLAACGSAPPSPSTAPTTTSSNAAPPPATSPPTVPPETMTPTSSGAPASGSKIMLALGYIPSVQFAPFYVAAERGYYADEGLSVEFQHGIQPDLLAVVGTGKLRYVVASGDEMLVARSRGVPLVYVGAFFQKYPVTLIVSERSGVDAIGDLKGKTVGVPGPYGATYTGLQALLASAGLTEADVSVRSIGFTQVQALQRGQVDAVMGYANNEPLQLERLGVAVRTFPVWETTDLVSNGIVTNESNLRANPDEVAALIRATMRGLEETIQDPEAAFEISTKFAPEAGAPENRALQLEVLRATIPLWQSDVSQEHGLGYSDPRAWESTLRFLKQSGTISANVELESAYTNRFITPEVSSLRGWSAQK